MESGKTSIVFKITKKIIKPIRCNKRPFLHKTRISFKRTVSNKKEPIIRYKPANWSTGELSTFKVPNKIGNLTEMIILCNNYSYFVNNNYLKT